MFQLQGLDNQGHNIDEIRTERTNHYGFSTESTPNPLSSIVVHRQLHRNAEPPSTTVSTVELAPATKMTMAPHLTRPRLGRRTSIGIDVILFIISKY